MREVSLRMPCWKQRRGHTWIAISYVQNMRMWQEGNQGLKNHQRKQELWESSCGYNVEKLDAVTGAVFESFLSFTAGINSRSKSSSWSLVSKLVHPKRVACEDEEVADTNEPEKVDAALHSLISHSTKKSDYIMQFENVQNCLRDWETNIQGFEGVLECLFGLIIKTRVQFSTYIFNH